MQVYFAGLGCLQNVRAALYRGRALKCTHTTFFQTPWTEHWIGEDSVHLDVMELEMLNLIYFRLLVCVVRTSEVVLFVECIRHRKYLLQSV